jgi:hypothetical protein
MLSIYRRPKGWGLVKRSSHVEGKKAAGKEKKG